MHTELPMPGGLTRECVVLFVLCAVYVPIVNIVAPLCWTRIALRDIPNPKPRARFPRAAVRKQGHKKIRPTQSVSVAMNAYDDLLRV